MYLLSRRTIVHKQVHGYMYATCAVFVCSTYVESHAPVRTD